jgi:hypothetical protein
MLQTYGEAFNFSSFLPTANCQLSFRALRADLLTTTRIHRIDSKSNKRAKITFRLSILISCASGGPLFCKKAGQKTFHTRSVIVLCFVGLYPIRIIGISLFTFLLRFFPSSLPLLLTAN